MKKYLFALACLLFATQADAATCFWVGGTGSWSTANTASWASATGGTTGTCAATGGVPKQAADTATFDASSGGGVVTVDTTMNGTTLTTINAGAFTGTLTFATNNPSMTFNGQMNLSGAGTRTINLGTGTFTVSGNNSTVFDCTTTTGLTDSFASATISIVATSFFGPLNFNGGGKTYGTVTVSIPFASSSTITNTGGIIGTLTVTGPSKVAMVTSQTITNTNLNGTSSGLVQFNGNSSTAVSSITFTNPPVATWVAIYAITAVTSTLTATNSFNMGNNTNVSITAPSGGGGGGGGGHIIGG